MSEKIVKLMRGSYLITIFVTGGAGVIIGALGLMNFFPIVGEYIGGAIGGFLGFSAGNFWYFNMRFKTHKSRNKLK